MRTAGGWLTMMWLSLLSSSLSAQRDDSLIPAGAAVGITLDRFLAGEEFRDHSATFHVSDLDPNSLTPEFGASVFARSLAAQSVIVNLDVGGAFNIAFPQLVLLIRGGASGMFAFGREQGGLPGVHYGISLLAKLRGRNGIRIDIIRRIYLLPSETLPATLTLGIGITSLPSL
jgi:hypothetical protein